MKLVKFSPVLISTLLWLGACGTGVNISADEPGDSGQELDGGISGPTNTNTGSRQVDDDGDGFTEDQGDCNDNPSALGQLVNPNALEVASTEDGSPEGFDNDCDGLVDEALAPCPEDAERGSALELANAADACHGLIEAGWNTSIGMDPRSHAAVSAFGDTYQPLEGALMSVLSTGIAGDARHAGFRGPQTGSILGNTAPHPAPEPANGCSADDPEFVNDYAELALTMHVPSNAQAFSFDFNFMSAEYPEFVCDFFDDTFLALLDSEAYQGNVSFDAMGNRVSINVGFFDVCPQSAINQNECSGNEPLYGTGYEEDGGGTGWLTTTSPVVPGETITLRFIIFDEGDGIYDSTVLLDNFRWELEAHDAPITVD